MLRPRGMRVLCAVIGLTCLLAGASMALGRERNVAWASVLVAFGLMCVAALSRPPGRGSVAGIERRAVDGTMATVFRLSRYRQLLLAIVSLGLGSQ